MGNGKKEAASFRGSLLPITTERDPGNEVEKERWKNKGCLLYSRKKNKTEKMKVKGAENWN